MLDPNTLYITNVIMLAMMTLLTLLTWRANKNTPGALLYIFYPMVLFAVSCCLFLPLLLKLPSLHAVANILIFFASVIHCLAIAQFLNFRGWELKAFLFITFLFTLVVASFSFIPITNELEKRIFFSGFQHITENIFLLYLFLRFARKPYPNGTIVYVIVLLIVMTLFILRSLFMGDIELTKVLENNWVSITFFANGIISPIFFATGMAILCNEKREQKFKSLSIKAQQDLEIRGLFLSTISHEIRTPLNGILGSAQLILTKSNDAKSKEYCEAIINSSESLNLLVDKVLDYASLDQSDKTLNEEDIDLKHWLKNLCLLLTPLAEQKALKLTVSYKTPEKICYYCDQQKLRQIIINLVGNAIKFTDNGEVKILIELCDESALYHTLRISIIDTGPGIEEQDIDKLTEPYVQSTAGKVKGGTGLGLAITSKLLDKLDSSLNIKSELGKGSTFSFDIILALGELSQVEKRKKTINIATGLNVLLVEDLELNQKIAIEFMAEDQHKVKLAADGKAAIELLMHTQFDVVLLDMNLPDLTGQEVLKQLQTINHKNQRTPFLAFTASLSPAEIKEYLTLGIKYVVGKPIKKAKLRQALHDSQRQQSTPIDVVLKDCLYDETAVKSLKSSFSLNEIDSIYNDFLLSARSKIIEVKELFHDDKEQCIRKLHRQANTALQLGFNRYGQALKHIERCLLDNKSCDEKLKKAIDLWQESLEAYLAFVRKQANR